MGSHTEMKIFFVLLSTACALKCQVCNEKRNHLGEMVIGEKGCFDGETNEFEQECGQDEQWCQVKIYSDWFSLGEASYHLYRSCSDEPVASEPCVEGTILLNAQWRDCSHQCDSDNCNSNNDEVFKLTSTGGQESCHTCSSYKHSNGTIEGHDDCHLEIQNDDYERLCPPYANKGCFDAVHKYQPDVDDENYAKYMRGCTPFSLQPMVDDTWSNCGISDDLNVIGPDGPIDDFDDHYVCKKTCQGENCNKIAPKRCVDGDFFADEHDCARYYHCSGELGEFKERYCLNVGQVWDPEIKRCNWAHRVDCCLGKRPCPRTLN